MSRVPSKIYRYHVANLQELQLALGHTGRLARIEIASKDPQKGLRSLLRLYSFLVGAWIETRLRKLLHEEFGFTEAERNQIEQKSSQLDQWKETVDLAFRKHHKITKAPLDERNLGVAHAARRAALHDVLSNELRILIEIRNKLAHGQWVYPFNSEGDAVEPDKFQLINKENLQSLQFKYSLAEHLADAVHDLVVSPATFERDFESHFKRLYQVRTNLVTKDYEKYKASLVLNREKSRATRTKK
ncbi:hypothetical protein QJ132_13685 [Klebsiella quasipneumoniae]|uniref:hypothetical protein n=1 Tax=Klebsiella pneumoniae complex TaxID=3390273 RepID=UPI00049F0607|nr:MULTISPECIES: hypothetical protein [Klebsiella]HBR1596471.1 hypothetical protein [Klebsiella quasipneumoniae subsp. quasipneumoniae]HCI6718994.1 hypothetical protein [Klebsiella variicola subsp. variicola]EKW4785335.1 hypothetical protein [Klebsiella variicola]KDL60843.1 hypothetical protein AD94_02019 [Klebsiella variicola]MDI3070644.1 hypothetical protein [Klebsiella quasipneumoniae]